jgi:sulfonate transport system permease protein
MRASEMTEASPTSDSLPTPTPATAAAAAAVERIALAGTSSTRRSTAASTSGRLFGIALLFAVWEVASRSGWLDARTLGAPSSVVDTGWEMIRDATLPHAIWASTQRVLWALLFGIPAGAVLAVVAGLCRPGDAVIDANMQILRYVPILAVQPLFILWFGIGETTKVVLLAVGVAFPVYINTQHAIRSIDAKHHELADVLGLSMRQRIRRVVVPGAVGGFLLGVRYASAVAWLLLIFAEQINAPEGLGRLMANAQAFSKSDVIVLVIVTYTALGVVSDLTVRVLERYALRWRSPR